MVDYSKPMPVDGFDGLDREEYLKAEAQAYILLMKQSVEFDEVLKHFKITPLDIAIQIIKDYKEAK